MYAVMHRHIAGMGVGTERVIEIVDTEHLASIVLETYAASFAQIPGLNVVEKTDTEFYLTHRRAGPSPRAYVAIEEI